MSEAGLTTVITVPMICCTSRSIQPNRKNKRLLGSPQNRSRSARSVYNAGAAASGPRELHVGCRDIVSRGQAPRWHSSSSCWQLANSSWLIVNLAKTSEP